MRPTTRTGTRHRRGAAMVEFALVLPLLATIIALTFFFGWALTNRQHVQVSARYQAWRRVEGGHHREPNDLNDAFYRGRATNVSSSGGPGPDGTLLDLVDFSSGVSAPAGIYAEDLVLYRFPRGRRVETSAVFPTDVPLWQRFEGAIHFRHVREGVTWRRSQARCGPTVREQYLQTVDEGLTAVPAPGTGLAEEIRRLYLHGW